MILALILIPFLAGLAAFFLRDDRLRRGLLLGTAVAHLVLTAASWARHPLTRFHGWLVLDAPEILFLSITSLLFAVTAIYAAGYLGRESRTRRTDIEEGFLFGNAPEATFTGSLLLFLGTMTLVIASHHFGLMWVAVEATTLASAPLIHFHRHHRSLEAAWKYVMICSVGIAVALLGNFFLVVATARAGAPVHAMTTAALVSAAGALDPSWLKAAFLLLLVGYGTKAGLAPLHTWLPDAHSEAPSVISALLSGALLNCALLAILRVQAVCEAAGLGEFSRGLLVLFGLVSMGLAAAFIIGQSDYKRMLAYSSVEHMGVASLGVGIGGAAAFGGLLHLANHSLAKAMLFLLAGNILAVYQTKSAGQVRGLRSRLPVTGLLWLAGFLAITGSPPFGLFLSELTILKGGLEARRYIPMAVYLLLLLAVFAGMAAIVLKMVHGRAGSGPEGTGAGAGESTDAAAGATQAGGQMAGQVREPLWSVLPPALLGLLVLGLGLFVPGPLRRLIEEATRLLGIDG